jgi:Family of unknown function (DUF5681)
MGSLLNSDRTVDAHVSALSAMPRPWQWQKGVSGNPRGRPPSGTALTDLLRHQLAQTADAKGKKTRAEAIAAVLIELALAGDINAIKLLIERVDGRLPNPVELSGAGGAVAIVLRWPENPELQ